MTGTEGEPVASARVVAVEAEAWSAPLADIETKYSGPHTGIPALHREYTALASQAASTRTVADGTYVFHGFPPGEYRVLVSHPDYLSSSESMAGVWANETARCDVELAPGTPLQGRVVDEAGRAVPGVLIACEPSRTAAARGMAKAASLLAAFSRGELLLEADTTRSGEDGTFSLRSLEPVPHDVKAAREGFATTWLRSATPGNQAVTLVLHRGASVSGRALGPDGSPVGGAEVELRETMRIEGKLRGAGAMADLDFLGERTRRATTGDDGRFRVEGIEAGTYDLAASVEGLPRETLEVRVGTEPVDLGDFRFDSPAAISGIVLGPTGAPLEGVRVRARLPVSPGRDSRESEREVLAEAASGAGGSFLLTGLPGGRFDVLASAGGGQSGVAKEVETGGRPTVIRLEEALAIAGVCIDPEGAPVEGARVGLEGDGPQVVTAADGSFELPGVPRESLSRGGIRLRARHPDYQGVSKRVEGEPEGRIEIRFSAASGPRGVVLDQARNPVARARVWAEVPGIPSAILAINPRYGSSVWACRTDEEGGFSLNLSWDPEWGSLEILAVHGRHGLARTSFTPGAHSAWPEIEIVLAPGSRIEGRVTDSAGAAVAGARVEARIATAAELPNMFREIKDIIPPARGIAATTGKDGGYRLEPLPTGLYEIEVSALDHARKVIDAVEVSGPVHGVDIALDAGSSISGRVVGDSGEPIQGAEVLALAESASDRRLVEILDALGAGGARVASTRSGADGRFELDRLPAGEVVVAALAPGFRPALIERTVPGGRIPDLVLVRHARLSGRVSDAGTGSPVPRFHVHMDFVGPSTADAFPAHRGTERAFEAADGDFMIEDVAPGTYDFKVSSPNHTLFRKRIVLAPGGETVVEARLERGERLEGVVKARATNAAVAGALLELRPAVPAESAEPWAKEKFWGQSGKDGEFAFPGLDAGAYDLLARHPDFFLDVEAGRIALDVPRDGAAPLEVVLAPAARLSGTLRARRPLDPERDRFFFVLGPLEEEGAKEAGMPPLQAFDLSCKGSACRGRVEAGGSFKASGLRPGRYRLEVHAARASGPDVVRAELSVVEPRLEAPDARPPAAVGEIELRAGETTQVELEVP